MAKSPARRSALESAFFKLAASSGRAADGEINRRQRQPNGHTFSHSCENADTTKNSKPEQSCSVPSITVPMLGRGRVGRGRSRSRERRNGRSRSRSRDRNRGQNKDSDMMDADSSANSSSLPSYNRRRSKSWSSSSNTTPSKGRMRRFSGSRRTGRSCQFGQIFQKRGADLVDRSSSQVANLLSELDLDRSPSQKEEQLDMSGEDTRRRRANSASSEGQLMEEEMPLNDVNDCARSRKAHVFSAHINCPFHVSLTFL